MPRVSDTAGAAASGYGSWDERLMREGDLWSAYANGSVVAPGTGAVTATLASFANVPIIGKATFLRSLTISADQPCLIQSSISGSDGTENARFPAHVQQVIVNAGGPVTIPLNVLIRSFNDFNGVIGVSLRKLLTAAGSETVNGAISVSGVTIADDLDFDAPKTILVIGDSRDNGKSGTKTANLYKFKFKAALAALGTRARLVYKARSGLNLAEQLAFAQAGWHDISRVSLGILDLGVNDAAQGVAGAAYTANLATYWSLFKSRNPTAKLVIVGPSPLADNTSEANAVSIRSAISTWVAAQDDPTRLAFIDMGSAFNRATTSNYQGGDGIHPSDAGQAAMWAVFSTAWSALGWVL